jgi:hypothetical protein
VAVPDELMGPWTARLRAVASRSLGGTPLPDAGAGSDERRAWVETFSDELGNRARVATPFLSAVLGIDPGPAGTGPLDLDDRLWWAVHNGESPVAEFGSGRGPLDPGLAEIAIESRTETELSAMHALFRLGLDRGEPGMIDRALDAARWQVDELQPDNGTNHPWGIHVFVVLAAREPDAGVAGAALMHAQTLLHNCQVQQGRPDRLSACILWDAGVTLGRLSPA